MDDHQEPRIREVGEKLAGQRKWLGGVFADDRLFGIPGFARRVLYIDPLTEEVYEIGPEVNRNGINNFKFLRGIELQGKVYGIPMHAGHVLKIEPIADGAKVSVLPFKSKTNTFQWHGGAIIENKYMVAVPCNADSVLRIDAQDQISFFGSLPSGGNKWYGAVCLKNFAVCVPFNARRVLRIFHDSVELIGPDFGESKAKYHGCVRANDSVIYGIPAHASKILRVDASGVVTCVGESLVETNNCGKYKYGGAICIHGAVYGIPCDARRIFKLDVATDTVTQIGPLLSPIKNKWQNAAIASDGRIYCAPCDAHQVLCIDPLSDLIYLYSLPDANPLADRFQGAYSDSFGRVWFIPENNKRVCLLEAAHMSPQFFRTKYLERLGLEPNEIRLDVILNAHLACIPFETIEAHKISERNQPLPLTQQAIFERLIARRRGGDCFVLNCGLYYLLQTLGYDVSFLPARVFAGPSRGRGSKMKPGFRAAPSHFALLVNNTYFLDVGLGEPPNGALSFFDQLAQTQITPDGMHSRFILDDNTSSKRILEWLVDGEWQPRLILDPDHPRCRVPPTALESDRDFLRRASVPTPLNNKLVVSRLTCDYKITLTLAANSGGAIIKRTSPRFGPQKNVQISTIDFDDSLLCAVRTALRTHFNIPYTETRDLDLQSSLEAPEIWWEHL